MRKYLIVDVGCGDARNFIEEVIQNGEAEEIKNSETLYVGVDYNLQGLERGKKLKKQEEIQNLELIHADARYLPFKDNSVDECRTFYIFSQAREAFENFVAIASEIHRALKPGSLWNFRDTWPEEIHGDLPHSYINRLFRVNWLRGGKANRLWVYLSEYEKIENVLS